MAIPIRPGVYKQEFDNSITMTVGGAGGIGIPARFEKGEIGVAQQIDDRETLERIYGKPNKDYNVEDYAYIDNLLYYTGNIVVSRVEDTESSYNKSTSSCTLSCENAQAAIFENGYSTGIDNKFNLTSIVKAINNKYSSGADRKKVWEAFLEDFLGGKETPILDNINPAILMLNNKSDFDEKYINSFDSKTRTMKFASVEVPDEDDSSKSAMRNALMYDLKDRAVIVKFKEGDDVNGIMAVSKVTNLSNIISFESSDQLNENYWEERADVYLINKNIISTREAANALPESDIDDSIGDVDETAQNIFIKSTENIKENIKRVGYISTHDESVVNIIVEKLSAINKDDILVAFREEDLINYGGTNIEDKVREKINEDNTVSPAPFGKLDEDDNIYFEEGVPVTIVVVDELKKSKSMGYIDLDEEHELLESQTAEGCTIICPNFTVIEDVTVESAKIEEEDKENSKREFCRVVAKTPGKWAEQEKIEVLVAPMSRCGEGGSYAYDEFLSQYFEYGPDTDEDGNYKADQIAVVVLVGDGSAMEKYICSVDKEAKDANGLSKYYEDCINKVSQYIYIGINKKFIDEDKKEIKVNELSETGTYFLPYTVALIGGNSSTKIDPLKSTNNVNYSIQQNDSALYAITQALKAFEDRSSVAIEYLCDGAFAGLARVKDALINLAVNVRCGDCVVVTGPKASTFRGVQYPNDGYNKLVDGGYVEWVNNSAENQYIAFYANTKMVYESGTDSYVWISCSSDAVGLNSRVDKLFERWYAVAGTRRGVLSNVIKLGWYPNGTTREYMTRDRMNPIIYERSDGHMIYDTMSLCSLNSDLSEFYNRKTLNYLQVNTENYLKKILFEINDETTRSDIVNSLTPFYRSVYMRRGLAEPALIQCDDKNNPASVRAQGICYVDIIIKMTRCIKRLVARYRVTAQTASLQFVSEE